MTKRAVALAGGGSLGAYEVGAFEALRELGIDYDIVTGTSIGALNGAFFATGEYDRCRKLWEDITPEGVMVQGVNISKRALMEADSEKAVLKSFMSFLKNYVKRRGSADITPFRHYVADAIDPVAVKNAPRKFGLVTTLLPRLSEVDLVVNDLPVDRILPYLHASSACAPVFPIEEIDGKKYIDGFYNNNLPIDFAFRLGAEEVIAIDLKLFSIKPQHSYFLSLPNVIYIAPFASLGSMLDFSQEPIRRHMRLGYLDTMKRFGRYRGYRFTFNNADDFEALGDEFLVNLAHENGIYFKNCITAITAGIQREMRASDYLLRATELVYEPLFSEAEQEKIWDLREFIALGRERLIAGTLNEDNKVGQRLLQVYHHAVAAPSLDSMAKIREDGFANEITRLALHLFPLFYVRKALPAPAST